MSNRETQERLGRLLESEFHRKATLRGYFVNRHCDQLGVNGIKAPMLHGPYKGFRLPDFRLLIPKQLRIQGTTCIEPWVEVKAKSRAPFYGIEQQHKHGIDLPNWRDYLTVARMSESTGYLVIGELDRGEIRIASFKRLEQCAQVTDACESFPNGGVFWPRDAFKLWGRFDRQNGQMDFKFDFRDNVDWRPPTAATQTREAAG